MKTLLVAGGSGGHLIPALSLAEQLKAQGPVLFLSTARQIDQTLFHRHQTSEERAGFEWRAVDLKKATPLWQWIFPPYLAHQFQAFRKIQEFIRRTRPDVVVGFGGFLSAAAVVACRRQGIPIVIHEQNLIPGRANRWAARLSRCVAVSFPETKDYFSSPSIVEVTGNPIPSLRVSVSPEEARRQLGLDPEIPTLLIMGGSQGSRIINDVVLAMWENNSQKLESKIQIIHIAGEANVSTVEKRYQALGMRAALFGFLHEIRLAYAAANLAISRAGATTLAELKAWRLPSILIPYPYAGGHQRANAQWLQNKGGAVVLEEKYLTPQSLLSAVEMLLTDSTRIHRMQEKLAACSNGSAAEQLGALVRRQVAGNCGGAG